ncbi:MAG TPA: hypothetical protein DCS93_31005 [Microscillaceae bacterium]|nr:hypothetical protein [Microscillaceae bacterium]
MFFYKQLKPLWHLKIGNQALAVSDKTKRLFRWAQIYFFCLNCSNYLLRPVRDELVLHYELSELPYFFTGTFACMLLLFPLLGRLNRLGNKHFLNILHWFFISNLFIFWWLLLVFGNNYWVHLAFFGWTSVFNLLSISLGWGLITNLFDAQQAKAFFVHIALAGSLGGMAGSGIAFVGALFLAPLHLLLLGIGVLGVALWCIQVLHKARPAITQRFSATKPPLELSKKDAQHYIHQIAGLVLLYTLLATFLYFEQAHLLAYAQSNDVLIGIFQLNRTAILALMALSINTFTLLLQLLVTKQVLVQRGMDYILSVVPSLLVICLITLSFYPVLGVLLITQVVYKTGNYALMRPARETLFTLISPDYKYRVKIWIDLIVYRGGDVLGSWLFMACLTLFGLQIEMLTLVMIPMAYIWQRQGRNVGRLHEKLLLEKTRFKK